MGAWWSAVYGWVMHGGWWSRWAKGEPSHQRHKLANSVPESCSTQGIRHRRHGGSLCGGNGSRWAPHRPLNVPVGGKDHTSISLRAMVLWLRVAAAVVAAAVVPIQACPGLPMDMLVSEGQYTRSRCR